VTCLDGEIFYTLKEAQIIIEQWRKHYNTKRPHSALGYRPPAPETIRPDGPRTGHALTFIVDHSMGADHWTGPIGRWRSPSCPEKTFQIPPRDNVGVLID